MHIEAEEESDGAIGDRDNILLENVNQVRTDIKSSWHVCVATPYYVGSKRGVLYRVS